MCLSAGQASNRAMHSNNSEFRCSSCLKIFSSSWTPWRPTMTKIVSDQMLTDLYTMLGSVRGLSEAMGNAQSVMNQINWPQWTATRF